MSKNKFKKKKSKHGKRSTRQIIGPIASQSSINDIVEQTELIEEEETAEEIKNETEAEKQEYAYVKKDVKKILIVIGSIFVLLFFAYYLSQKTPIFNSMGNWLYGSLNIQTQ